MYICGINKSNQMKKLFTSALPLDYAGAPIGNVTLNCIVYLYADGTYRNIDINEALFNGKDIADYVSAAQPDTWDEWLGYAEDTFKEQNEEPSLIEND